MSRMLQKSYWLLPLCIMLGLALSSCGFPGVISTSAQLPQVTPAATQTLPPIHFPQDEGAHNDLTEWWYYTGHLEATDDQAYTSVWL